MAKSAEEMKFEFACTEYREVCQNVRSSWDYIILLIRQYFVFQILLIWLIGLGNYALQRDFIEKIISGTTTKPEVRIDTGTTGNESTKLSDKELALVERKRIEEERKLSYQDKSRWISVIFLGFLGLILSGAAVVQSNRIFSNARAFVERAAALELKYGAGSLSVGSGNTESVHQYMLGRLSNVQLRKMSTVMTVGFIVGCLVWFCIFILMGYAYL